MGLDKVQFPTNIPVELNLAFRQGRECDSKFGSGKQYMFSTRDQRVAFVPPIVADAIHKFNTDFVIVTKKEKPLSGGRKMIEWEVEAPKEFPGDDPIESAPAGATNTDQGIGLKNQQTSQAQTQATTPAPGELAVPRVMPSGFKDPAHIERPKTKLEDALKTVVSACYEATLHAKAIGYDQFPPFKSEDIRTMANTLMIEHRGGAR